VLTADMRTLPDLIRGLLGLIMEWTLITYYNAGRFAGQAMAPCFERVSSPSDIFESFASTSRVLD
jgi:hypothetical protein